MNPNRPIASAIVELGRSRNFWTSFESSGGGAPSTRNPSRPFSGMVPGMITLHEFHGDVGPIADDAGHAPLDDHFHICRLIDDPRLHGQTGSTRRFDERAVQRL